MNMTTHKTKTLADTYECPTCSTLYKLADLIVECQHPALGKYKVQHDVAECPFCFAIMDLELSKIVIHPEPVARNEAIAGLLKLRYRLEQKVAEIDARKVRNECVSVMDNDEDPHSEETGFATKIKQRAGAAVGERSGNNAIGFNTHLQLAEADARIAIAVDVKGGMPKHAPRTVGQNCLSHTHTIKSQVDWARVDALIAEFGLPLPVDMI